MPLHHLQIATFLLGSIHLLVEQFPDHQSFLSPNAPQDKVNAAIAKLVSAPTVPPPVVGYFCTLASVSVFVFQVVHSMTLALIRKSTWPASLSRPFSVTTSAFCSPFAHDS